MRNWKGWMLMGCLLASPALGAQPTLLDADTFDSNMLFAAGHPNERSRLHGIKAYNDGRMGDAHRHFRRGAHYGDKLSQYFLSLIYWHGEGVATDPVLAYIWSDLAAERGNQPLLAHRESIWASLSSEQRLEATERGIALYDRYGDAAAIPRTNAQIRRFAASKTGTRVGSDSTRMGIALGRARNVGEGEAGGQANLLIPIEPLFKVSQATFYGAARTRPSQYWLEQNRILESMLGSGKVNVGEVEPVRDR